MCGDWHQWEAIFVDSRPQNGFVSTKGTKYTNKIKTHTIILETAVEPPNTPMDADKTKLYLTKQANLFG